MVDHPGVAGKRFRKTPLPVLLVRALRRLHPHLARALHPSRAQPHRRRPRQGGVAMCQAPWPSSEVARKPSKYAAWAVALRGSLRSHLRVTGLLLELLA